MAKNRDAYYFKNFIECAQASCQAGAMLKEVLQNFKPEELPERLDAQNREQRRYEEA